ncbi:MAG: UbiX family flavin prenyltransferase, partial [Clostridia bacterium]|nr:UbiX family flavin prenyltransferase [Clostridia bacterium]
IETVRQLTAHGVETHLVISNAARYIIVQETGQSPDDLSAQASFTYGEGDFTAPIASGSFRHDGMVIAPCSMKTLAAVATGYASNLIQRAADVSIKEGRKLVILPRESPFSAIHLENMLKLARLGIVIMPPVPAFYTRPETIADIVGFTVGRILDQFSVPHNLIRRWGEPSVSEGS